MIKKVVLKKNEDRRITSGHLWAFSNEIERIGGEPQAGEVVELHNQRGEFLGIGFYNPHSLIAVRLLSRTREEINVDFFRKYIESSFALRKKIYPKSETFRLVHGESDFLPGLIIDKYNEYFSIQTFSYGMDQRLDMICDVLEELYHPKGIVERNESLMRTYEGLPQENGVLRGSVNTTVMSEFDIQYNVNLSEGQKTGFFLDQRENRFAIRRYSENMKVLDCFCNDGGFALNAARGGASHVIGVDSSETAIQRASKNALLNKLQQTTSFVVADAFEYLSQAVESKQKFDVIILDPPSFTKNRKTINTAKRGYKEIHSYAFQLLNAGGILASASCSQHMYEEIFLDIINKCATDAGKKISLLEWRGAAPDHPVLPGMPETRYLKFGIFRVE